MMVIVFLDFLQFSQICQEMVWDSGFQLDVTVINLAGFRLYTSEQIYNILWICSDVYNLNPERFRTVTYNWNPESQTIFGKIGNPARN